MHTNRGARSPLATTIPIDVSLLRPCVRAAQATELEATRKILAIQEATLSSSAASAASAAAGASGGASSGGGDAAAAADAAAATYAALLERWRQKVFELLVRAEVFRDEVSYNDLVS